MQAKGVEPSPESQLEGEGFQHTNTRIYVNSHKADMSDGGIEPPHFLSSGTTRLWLQRTQRLMGMIQANVVRIPS